jgi:hypothetical protein
MTMFGEHVTRHLSAYYHGELSAELHAQVQDHLRECARCRTKYDEIRFGASMASLLKPAAAPDSIWAAIQKADSRPKRWTPQLAAAAATFTLVAVFSAFLSTYRPAERLKGDGWVVESRRGAPQIQNVTISPTGSAKWDIGETLRTDAASQARVQIANIGELIVDTNTKVRLMTTSANEHRIALDQGSLYAVATAPPRRFVVDTPSASVIDLGSIFNLAVEKDGSSLLFVEQGLVLLTHGGRQSFVPLHTNAKTRSGLGPGTPFHAASSDRFRTALEAIDIEDAAGRYHDFGNRTSRHIDVVLSEAIRRDAPTLWHLLSRIHESDRARVYDQLAAFVPPPDGVTRTGILALDAEMLRAWGIAIPELAGIAR